MNCPQCGATGLVHDTRDIPFTYQGETIVFPSVSGLYCDSCGDNFPDPEEANILSNAMVAFVKSCKKNGSGS
ncbi:type II toxin-antitoxin system MqsA family antitoxin [Burkholderia sp. Cy-637]|uniref:type II toxin-antitoxin system MqsA family antitoxin n=1 Tax=Burkholderia sp. Cy-637 TaxID=2608327 RepID=UPI001423F376|nr:type II toxin-antitoxin system MqsA family antitoxin [Burkholderia sp. Cy-637]NIF90020.1 YgiT-type zinc finger protein [Burkholderia sp. Cy-637]